MFFFQNTEMIQMYVSKNLKAQKKKIMKKCNLIDYISPLYPTLFFFDEYDICDIEKIKNHSGVLSLMLYNIDIIYDCDFMNLDKKINSNGVKILQHIYTRTQKDQKLLNSLNIKNILINDEIIDDNHYMYDEDIFYCYDIEQLYVSPSLSHLKNRIMKKYKLDIYDNNESSTLFFGLYTKQEINFFLNHEGKKYLMFGGSDINFIINNNYVDTIIKNQIRCVFAISPNIHNKLNNIGIKNTLISFNIVDKCLFKPVKSLGSCIYIYNGFSKNQENVYSKNVYEKVIELLPNYKYIFSNSLNVKYEQMPDIYAKCFIGLRLCNDDGNANTVQELNAMKIPVVHNSETGIHWNSVDDIVKIIKHYETKKERIFSINDFDSFNIECDFNYYDVHNELNIMELLKKNNKTIFANGKFICGDIKKIPEITLVKNKTVTITITEPKTPIFSSYENYNENYDGIFCTTKSWIKYMSDKNNLHEFLDSINSKPIILIEQKNDNCNVLQGEETK